MLRLVFLAVVVGTPACANVAEVSDCSLTDPVFGFQSVECNVTNVSDAPMAALRYGIRITEVGRAVPWQEFGLNMPDSVPTGLLTRVPGGIEPGETVPVSFLIEPLNERAQRDNMEINLVIIYAKDVHDNLINGTSGSSATSGSSGALSQADIDILRLTIEDCWNVGQLSREAMQVEVTIAFEMTADARPVTESIRLVEASGGDMQAQQEAFSLVSIAINACARDGFGLPPQLYDQWREVEITFDLSRMNVR